MNKTEKTLLDKAAADKYRWVPVSYRQERAASWLHAEGYGIWLRDADPPRFIIFPHVQKAWLARLDAH